MHRCILLTCTFLLIGLVSPGSALNCFVCKTESDSNCKDASKIKAITCQHVGITPACLKSTAFNTETNQLEIDRACAFVKQDSNDACETKKNKLISAQKYKDIHCNTCTEDECNNDSLPKSGNAAALSAVTSNCHLMLSFIIALFSLRRICN